MRNYYRIFKILYANGLGYGFKIALSRISRRRKFVLPVLKLFKDKYGLEVGGPTRIFGNEGYLPLYKIVKELDGCNFSNNTIWGGSNKSGENYIYYENKKGILYITEANDLSFIPNSKYEFVISSNCLEHIANPLKAIEEWIRVINTGGLLLLILPNKAYSFDHNRPVTEFSHLLKDYHSNIKEDDLTHLKEILELHDLEMDKPAGNLEKFRERSMRNFENRALHHHIFDISSLVEIFNFFKLEVLLSYEGQGHIILGKKTLI